MLGDFCQQQVPHLPNSIATGLIKYIAIAFTHEQFQIRSCMLRCMGLKDLTSWLSWPTFTQLPLQTFRTFARWISWVFSHPLVEDVGILLHLVGLPTNRRILVQRTQPICLQERFGLMPRPQSATSTFAACPDTLGPAAAVPGSPEKLSTGSTVPTALDTLCTPTSQGSAGSKEKEALLELVSHIILRSLLSDLEVTPELPPAPPGPVAVVPLLVRWIALFVTPGGQTCSDPLAVSPAGS